MNGGSAEANAPAAALISTIGGGGWGGLGDVMLEEIDGAPKKESPSSQ